MCEELMKAQYNCIILIDFDENIKNYFIKKLSSLNNTTTVNFADEAIKSDSLFRLISKSGDDTPPGERGLLLYKGGTVCDYRYERTFSDYSATAICKEMGYKQAAHWTSGYLYDPDYQEGFDIALGSVRCDNEDWKSCSYSTFSSCFHYEDVLLTCTGEN